MGRGSQEEHWQAGGALGDIVMELHKEGHISNEQAAAVGRFLRDLRAARGSSEGMVGQINERVQSSTRHRDRPPGIPATVGHERSSYVINQLRLHERETLHFLITQREVARGSLSDWGRRLSGYQTQKTARAAATGHIRALVATILELYNAEAARHAHTHSLAARQSA